MRIERARELVAAERTRIEAELSQASAEVDDIGELERQQTGEAAEVGSELQVEGVDMALVASLQERLEAVSQAEARIAAGTYGRSVESGAPIPDERLEAEPLAERTVEEERAFESLRR